MPLYLVRWPRGRVSLVRANNENHLTDLIDSCGDPGDCTWKMYGGAVWVDFGMDGIEHIGDRPGPAEPADFKVECPMGSFPRLEPRDYDDTEIAAEMQDAIMSWAYPNLAKAVDKTLDESGGSAEGPADQAEAEILAKAIARDEVRHCDAIAEKGTTLDPGTFGPVVARKWYLRRTASGFTRLLASRVERFIYGRAKIKPDEDGSLRIASFRSSWMSDEGRHRVVFDGAIRLRASADGSIDPAHRADAFPETEDPVAKLFEQRRNAAVAWNPSADDWSELQHLFEARLYGRIEIEAEDS